MSILNYLKVISKSSSDQKHSDFTATDIQLQLDHENSQPRTCTVAILQPLDWAKYPGKHDIHVLPSL